MDVISVAVPCHNEEESLPLLYDEIVRVRGLLDERHPGTQVELVLVDDGSRDRTLEEMRSLAARNDEGVIVRYLSFSRNFGKEAALYAGLENATGDYVSVMDADLQDPPDLLIEMYDRLLSKDIGCVATRRRTRKGEPPVRSWFARRFYGLINRMSDTEIVDGARDFRLMTRRMTDAVLSLGERGRFSKGIFSWVGFETEWISYDNVERVAGQSSWSFSSLFRYAIEGIVSFTTAPLDLASTIGIVMCLVALLAVIFLVVRAAIFGDPVPGWPSLACLITFIGGLELFCIGVIGKYLANVFTEVKRRPIYITKESNIDKEERR